MQLLNRRGGGRTGARAHCGGSAAMGNAQEKPPGSGRGAAAGTGTSREDLRSHPGQKMANGTPGEQKAEERSGSTVDTSHLDAPAGALPPHLARLKNEGNHLFKHGQFGDALEKYSQAIDGCAEEGGDTVRRTTLCELLFYFIVLFYFIYISVY